MSDPAFDPRAWLDFYVQAGGAYVLTLSDSPVFLITGIDPAALATALRQIAGRPERLRAVREQMEIRL